VRRIILGALTVAIIGWACAPAGGTPATSITADAAEFAFTPNSWTVAADKEISITFNNKGQVDHEWVIIKDQKQIANESEFAEDLVYFEVEALPAGQNTTETFTAPAAGTYQIICALEGHLNAGMKGTLTSAP
jgi:uncharacterized cupredoxin-like copper-binding protein